MKKFFYNIHIAFFIGFSAGVIGFFGVAQSVFAQEDGVPVEEVVTETAEEKEAREAKEQEEKDAQEKEEKQEELEDEKKDIKKDLKKAEEKKEVLQQALNAQYVALSQKRSIVAQTETQVQAKEQLIRSHEKEIERLHAEERLQVAILQTTLRQLYYAQGDSQMTNLFEHNPTTQFLGAEDYLDALRAEAQMIFDAVIRLRDEEQKKREETEAAKKEQEKLLAEQKKQEQAIAVVAAGVQSEVKRAEATISQLNAQLSSIESSLSSLLGKSFDTDDIVDAAKFASKKTGVRKDFILGMLTQETSLGRFTGGCTYKESRMGSANEKIFKRVTKDLGYDYKKKKVSCPLSYGIGGAMGVAQFMPTTWVSYEKTVAKYTGNNPADPWSLTDGVMAMAIKLKWDGGDKESGENTAARRYYCGSNLSRSVCANYAASVAYWADNYKRLLK